VKKYLKLKEVDYLENLNNIDRQEVKLLWSYDWWDGPISGMLIYREEKCWFQLFTDSDDPEVEKLPRRYLVIELSKDQLEEKEHWQNLFLEKVGGNNVIDENGIMRTDRLSRPLEIQKEFFRLAKNRQPADLTENRVVGFFEKGITYSPD
jgi:hypothetical protein